MYTGPCFQPINNWLRNVGRVDADTRIRLAKSAEFTYSATVRHIVDGIRKLAKARPTPRPLCTVGLLASSHPHLRSHN